MRSGKTVEIIKSPSDLAPYIDHTFLKPDATTTQIRTVCDEARQYGFFGVCISPRFVELAAACLSGSRVFPVTVVGFPSGASTTEAKVYEALNAIRAGAREIDMVLAIGALKEKAFDYLKRDIREVTKACGMTSVKVIIETALLTDEEKKWACELSFESGARFIKTCTGFNGGGATVEDIKLMRGVVGKKIGVKASGGIKTYEQAKALVEAGANRLGMSASVAIVTGGSGQGPY
ncbi:MAG: deoxyribose-phosphate aldolase [Pseudobdellovibrionaceae bacterium]